MFRADFACVCVCDKTSQVPFLQVILNLERDYPACLSRASQSLERLLRSSCAARAIEPEVPAAGLGPLPQARALHWRRQGTGTRLV